MMSRHAKPGRKTAAGTDAESTGGNWTQSYELREYPLAAPGVISSSVFRVLSILMNVPFWENRTLQSTATDGRF
jgi:hypothetical protein